MARVLITGSADGLGLMAGKRLVEQGHAVTLHARSTARANDARALLEAEDVLVGDVSTLEGMRRVAEQANQKAPFDAVIHNVAIGYREPARSETEDGVERVFAVNSLAPYVLTALIHRPARLVYLSSGLHRSGAWRPDDLQWRSRRWNGLGAYSDSKLHDVILAFAVARLWPGVPSNALEPGWVATKMGGPSAPDDLSEGAVTQAWLAVSSDRMAQRTAGYFFHRREMEAAAVAREPDVQDLFLARCEELSGVRLPR